MTLTAHALTTVDNVKTELGISSSTDDSYIERLVNAYSAAIETYCGRCLEYSAAVVEQLAGHGDPHLVLSRTPVIEVASLKLSGSTIDSGNYDVHDAAAGIVVLPGFTAYTGAFAADIAADPVPGYERKLYEATYAGGYVTPAQLVDDEELAELEQLPAEIEQACIIAVVGAYRSRGRDRNISSESLLSYSVSYRQFATDVAALPAESRALLDAYKRVVLA